MAKSLFAYYEEELAQFREQGSHFAARHPHAASELGLSRNAGGDPDTERLLQGSAFLTARIRRNIEDQFSVFADLLLETIQPTMALPVPARFVAQCSPSPSGTQAVRIPRGAVFESIGPDKESFFFSSIYDTEILPLRVTRAELVDATSLPPSLAGRCPDGALTITVACTGEASLEELAPETLRFHLDDEASRSHYLYELLMEAGSPFVRAADAWFHSEAVAESPAFGEKTSLFPDSVADLHGVNHIHEYFLFPEKYLFVDVRFSASDRAKWKGKTADLYFPCRVDWPLDGVTERLFRRTDACRIRLNAVPMVNLFQKKTEPVRLTHERADYPVKADHRHGGAKQQVYRIEDVRLIRGGRGGQTVIPVYPLHERPLSSERAQCPAWTVERRQMADGGREWRITVLHASDGFGGAVTDVLSVTAFCSNGDAPAALRPRVDGRDLACEAFPEICGTLLRAPFPPVPEPDDAEKKWRLIACQAVNRAGLQGGKASVQAALSAYHPYTMETEPHECERVRRIIDGIASLSMEDDARRFGPVHRRALCAGVHCRVTFDEQAFRGAGAGVYLFSQLTMHFMEVYAAIHSYVALTASSTQRQKVVKAWPPRAGSKPLI